MTRSKIAYYKFSLNHFKHCKISSKALSIRLPCGILHMAWGLPHPSFPLLCSHMYSLVLHSWACIDVIQNLSSERTQLHVPSNTNDLVEIPYLEKLLHALYSNTVFLSEPFNGMCLNLQKIFYLGIIQRPMDKLGNLEASIWLAWT